MGVPIERVIEGIREIKRLSKRYGKWSFEMYGNSIVYSVPCIIKGAE